MLDWPRLIEATAGPAVKLKRLLEGHNRNFGPAKEAQGLVGVLTTWADREILHRRT